MRCYLDYYHELRALLRPMMFDYARDLAIEVARHAMVAAGCKREAIDALLSVPIGKMGHMAASDRLSSYRRLSRLADLERHVDERRMALPTDAQLRRWRAVQSSIWALERDPCSAVMQATIRASEALGVDRDPWAPGPPWDSGEPVTWSPGVWIRTIALAEMRAHLP